MNKTEIFLKEVYTMVRYGLVGMINTGVTALIFFILKLLGFKYLLYTLIGYSIGITISFFLNRHFTFKKRNESMKRQAIKFFGVTVSLMLLTMLLQYLLIDLIHVPELIGVITGMVFYTVMGYILNRNLVFRYDRNNSS
jgi:putative flippase GtrA